MANENETVEQVCEKMKEPSIYKGRFPASFFDGEFCEFADRILAAHKSEIAEMDAEIASLRVLVKELADALNHELSTGCVCCLAAHQTSKCPHSVCDRNENRALVAKAREVCNV